MSYHRVIPRDLFNEAKLLKCLGRLIILRGEQGLRLRFRHRSPRKGFQICMSDSGDLFCRNLIVGVARWGGVERVEISLPSNSRSPWPLEFIDSSGGVDSVFKDDGSLSTEFIDFINEDRYELAGEFVQSLWKRAVEETGPSKLTVIPPELDEYSVAFVRRQVSQNASDESIEREILQHFKLLLHTGLVSKI